MPPLTKNDVKKQDFIIVKEKNNLDIAKIVAPHELQVGIDGFKNTSLRVKGAGYVEGSLEVAGGVKGALKLPDGTLALKAGSGIRVVDSGNGTATLSLGSQAGGLETLVRPGDGIMASTSNGIVTLSLNRETTLPHFIEGTGVKISRLANSYTLALDTSYISAAQAGVVVASGSGLIGTATAEGLLSLSLDQSFIPQPLSINSGAGISFLTEPDGSITISSTASGSSNLDVIATDGVSGSLSGSTLTLSLDRTGLALLDGSIFTGNVVAQAGLSGSLTTLADGSTPYLKAGTGISIQTGSNGQVEISSVAGAGAGVGTELVMNVSPFGTQDGENSIFELADEPADASSFMLWLNGQLMTRDSDYLLNGKTVTFTTGSVPESGDVIRAMYSKTVTAKLYSLNVAPTQLILSESAMTGLVLPHEPDPADSLMLFLNGQLLTQGNGHDYYLTGREVTFYSQVESLDMVRATYSYAV